MAAMPLLGRRRYHRVSTPLLLYLAVGTNSETKLR